MSKITEITRENCRLLLAAFMEENKLTARKVAKVISCSEITMNRIIGGRTKPTDEMLKQAGILMGIGFDKYSKLSKAEKEKYSEALGTVGGGILGFGSISAVVSSLGLAGLSGAGIVSGLAALGAVVGGGMIAGVSMVAAIPIAAAAVGYGIIKGVKTIFENYKTDDVRYDSNWEIPLDEEEKKILEGADQVA